MIQYVLKVLSQPSTYAGLSGLALAAGLSQAVTEAAAAASAAVFALIAVIVNERGNR